MKKTLLLLVVLAFFGCGEKSGPEIVISFSNSSAFADPRAVDLILVAESQASASGILDLNGDGVADSFAYPSTCTTSFSAGCGVTVSSTGTFALGNLPLGYTYSLEAHLRDSSGASLYSGSYTLVNDGSPQSVSIIVNATAE